MGIKKKSENVYEIEKTGKMNVPGIIIYQINIRYKYFDVFIV
jgi:hypothetical protein